MNMDTDLPPRRNKRRPCKKKGLTLIATSSSKDETKYCVVTIFSHESILKFKNLKL